MNLLFLSFISLFLCDLSIPCDVTGKVVGIVVDISNSFIGKEK